MVTVKKEHEYLELGSKVAFQSIWVLLFMAIIKLAAGLTSGVVVLIADALDSFTDMVTLFAAYVGLKISEKSEDKGFRYGYYKVETLASLFISLLIIFLGISIFRHSLGRFQILEAAGNPIFGLFAVALGTLASLRSAKKLKNVGKKINSLSLFNCGKDKENDIFMGFGVLIGIGANYFQVPYIEGFIGMAISTFILKSGFELAQESLFYLLDFFDDQNLIKIIRRTILKHSKIVTGVRDIRMRRAGTILFGEAVLEINPYSEIKEIRSVLKKLKEEIQKKNKFIKYFSLYTAIPEPKKIRVAIPAKEDKGLDSEVAISFKETKAYIFVDIENGIIGNRYSKKFKFKAENYDGMANFFDKEKTNIIVNNDMHSLLFYNLRHLRHIIVYPNFSNTTTVENAVKLLTIDIN